MASMRITRLHLVVALLVVLSAGVALYKWELNRQVWKPISPPAPSLEARQRISTHPDNERPLARQIAEIGAAYVPILKHSGDVPSISHPLRVAKACLLRGQLSEAATAAEEARVALRTFKKTRAASPESYEVVKGDTLWKIARDHSPVHQGPGWVTLWKANKRLVKNFNRIEVGWNIKIPEQPDRYIEPYWRPKGSHLAAASPLRSRDKWQTRQPQPSSLEVDLPVVLAWAQKEGRLSALPVKPPSSSLEVDLPAVLAWAQQNRKPAQAPMAAVPIPARPSARSGTLIALLPPKDEEFAIVQRATLMPPHSFEVPRYH